MIKHIVNKKENNKTIENILISNYKINKNLIYKALRKKDIKINGRRVSSNTNIFEGDIIEAYIFLENERKKNDDEKYYNIVFEDDNVLIVEKKQGISVSKNESDDISLIDIINKDNKKYELCHRLDRNTGGLLIVSKKIENTESIKEAINNRFYKKIYKCIVNGDASDKIGKHRAWLFKDSAKNKVYIYDDKKKYSKEIITEIISAKYNKKNKTTELEINLITGRTHQIRAHLAHLGHFVIGDGKYGVNDVNKQYGLKFQALWACALLRNDKFNSTNHFLPLMDFYSNPKYE